MICENPATVHRLLILTLCLIFQDSDVVYQSKLCMSVCMHDFILDRCNCSTAQLADYRHPEARRKAHKYGTGLCNDIGPDKDCLEKLSPELAAEKARRV